VSGEVGPGAPCRPSPAGRTLTSASDRPSHRASNKVMYNTAHALLAHYTVSGDVGPGAPCRPSQAGRTLTSSFR
jgi:hypothetical protein